MLNKQTRYPWTNLLVLAVFLYISPGLQIIHPLMHSHEAAAHDSGYSVDQIKEDEHHSCPICDFFATVQFHRTVIKQQIKPGLLPSRAVPDPDRPLLKTVSRTYDSRSPPFSICPG